jgi:uncharacterized protein (TIGR00730 family)
VAEPRRYQLQNETANRLIGELIDAAAVPSERRGLVQQMLTTVLKLHEDGATTGDLKITNTALKELRYAYKVFAPYRAVRKVTVFGSARTAGSEAAALAARDFGRRMVQEGWMVVTGAGAGIMGAAQEGAGGEQSFGLNIRLPFEQEANPWIASDPKLITFKYFFTRKLFLVKEASAVVLFPGGFGTMDECFELLTLMQTGKSEIVPVVLVETGPRPYWRIWDRFVQGTLVDRRLIDGGDTAFYRIVDDAEAAVREITAFYRVYHSSRIVGDNLVFRLKRTLTEEQIRELQERSGDILKGPLDQAPGPVPQELNEYPELSRLIIPFNRSSYSRLRRLIDAVNDVGGADAGPPLAPPATRHAAIATPRASE